MLTIRFLTLAENEERQPVVRLAGTVTADGGKLTATSGRLLRMVRQSLMGGVDLTDPTAVEAALATAPDRFHGTYFWAERDSAAGSGARS